MKFTTFIVLALMLSFAITAMAQDAPKVEISGDYSLLVYNPAKNFSGSRNLSGGGGALVYNFGKYFGAKAEFQGYGSTTATFVVPAGTPISAGTYNTQGNMFTYLFGPQINFRAKKFKVFGEALFGGAHSNVYANLYKTAGYAAGSAGNNGFAMAMGGGLDINAGKAVSFRLAEVDYFLTRMELPALGVNNQSNFRFLTGVVFNLGGSK